MLSNPSEEMPTDSKPHSSSTLPRYFKCWGNEAVIYDTASGDTHYLKPMAFALYETCRDHPGYTAHEIAAALATRLGVPDVSYLHELTKETLAWLHGFGLLESA